MDPKKISELNELITADVDDVLPIVNEGETKKISLSNLTNLKLDASKVDTDTELTANSDSKVASQRAIKTYVDTQIGLSVTALWENKGTIDCSGNPNYPEGESGDAYVVSVAGKIGGASGPAVQVRDVIVCISDSDGGTEADAGDDWEIIQANLDQATESIKGIAEIATTEEVNAGTDDQRIVTPAKLAAQLTDMVTKDTGTDNYLLKWSDGDDSIATDSQLIDNGTNVGLAVGTPGARLHIKGSGATSSTKSLRVDNSSSTNLFSVYDNGCVTLNSSSIGSANFTLKGNSEVDVPLEVIGGSGSTLITTYDDGGGSAGDKTVDIGDCSFDINTGKLALGGHPYTYKLGIRYSGTFSNTFMIENGTAQLTVRSDASENLIMNFGDMSSAATVRIHGGAGASFFMGSLGVGHSSPSGKMHIYSSASSGTTGILRVEAGTGSGKSYLHVATNGETTIGETGYGIIAQDAALVVNASTSDSTKYAVRVCDSSTNPVFGARADGRVCIGNVGGSLSDFTATLRLSSSSSSSSDHVFDATSGALSNILHVRADGRVGIGTSSPSGLLHIASDTIRLDTSRTPASSSASGNAGEICWDSSYIYVCISSNTWKRVAISTW